MRAFTFMSFGSFALVLAGVAGCSSHASPAVMQDPQGIPTAQIPSALDEANGGMTTTDEAPAFGDPAVSSLVAEDATYADTADDPSTSGVKPMGLPTAGSQQPGTGYHVLLLWGHFPPAADTQDADSAASKPVTWTGSLHVDAGGIGLRRTVSFDANDHVDPRTSASELSFVSHTLPYVDGLLVRVVIPQGGSPVLHFDTDALKTDIDLSQLASQGGGAQRLPGDSDTGLAWVGFQDTGCAKGFTFGRWVKDKANVGRFRTRVLSADGVHIGHVRGIWGHAAKRDKNVFIGKYIDVAGHMQGFTFGTYGGGTYEGIWAAKDETDIDVGTLGGVYSDGYDGSDGHGVTLGRWAEKSCK